MVRHCPVGTDVLEAGSGQKKSYQQNTVYYFPSTGTIIHLHGRSKFGGGVSELVTLGRLIKGDIL